MGKFYWNIRRTHRTSMKFSAALSLTLVFLATVFAAPKPKTYLVETADPELDGQEQTIMESLNQLSINQLRNMKLNQLSINQLRNMRLHQLSINQLRNMKLNQLRNMRLHQLSINQLRNTETGSMFCN